MEALFELFCKFFNLQKASAYSPTCNAVEGIAQMFFVFKIYTIKKGLTEIDSQTLIVF